jgi:hypothetical protein
MEHLCPICKRELTKEHKIKHVDYHCYPPKSDHHYSERETITGEKLKVKIRIGSGEDRLFLKVNYDESYSQVWTDPDDDDARIRINHAFEPDVSDLDALRKKLRTYMVFS